MKINENGFLGYNSIDLLTICNFYFLFFLQFLIFF